MNNRPMPCGGRGDKEVPANGAKRSSLFKLTLAVLLTLVPALGRAEICGYIDDDDVVHFVTDKNDPCFTQQARGVQLGALLSQGVAGEGKAQRVLARMVEHPQLKKYDSLLRAASSEFAVDLALLKAVVAAESAFDPDAVSPKGAIGLMQVMPATAERYGLAGDGKRTLTEKLRDPQVNIRLGARYLADLFRRFPYQRHLVVASYNAGEGAVERYRNTVPPYAETQSYVKWVDQLYLAFGNQAPMTVHGTKIESGPTGRVRVVLPAKSRNK